MCLVICTDKILCFDNQRIVIDRNYVLVHQFPVLLLFSVGGFFPSSNGIPKRVLILKKRSEKEPELRVSILYHTQDEARDIPASYQSKVMVVKFGTDTSLLRENPCQ